MTPPQQVKALQKALIKDFEQLYVKGFTTDWREQRMVRELEIKVMTFDNLKALIATAEREALKNLLPFTLYVSTAKEPDKQFDAVPVAFIRGTINEMQAALEDNRKETE